MPTGDYCPRCRGVHDILKKCPTVKECEQGAHQRAELHHECCDEVRRLELQVDELKKSDAAWKGVAMAASTERDEANRLNQELQKQVEQMKRFLPHDGRPCYGPGCDSCENEDSRETEKR